MPLREKYDKNLKSRSSLSQFEYKNFTRNWRICEEKRGWKLERDTKYKIAVYVVWILSMFKEEKDHTEL